MSTPVNTSTKRYQGFSFWTCTMEESPIQIRWNWQLKKKQMYNGENTLKTVYETHANASAMNLRTKGTATQFTDTRINGITRASHRVVVRLAWHGYKPPLLVLYSDVQKSAHKSCTRYKDRYHDSSHKFCGYMVSGDLCLRPDCSPPACRQLCSRWAPFSSFKSTFTPCHKLNTRGRRQIQ